MTSCEPSSASARSDSLPRKSIYAASVRVCRPLPTASLRLCPSVSTAGSVSWSAQVRTRAAAHWTRSGRSCTGCRTTSAASRAALAAGCPRTSWLSASGRRIGSHSSDLTSALLRPSAGPRSTGHSSRVAPRLGGMPLASAATRSSPRSGSSRATEAIWRSRCSSGCPRQRRCASCRRRRGRWPTTTRSYSGGSLPWKPNCPSFPRWRPSWNSWNRTRCNNWRSRRTRLGVCRRCRSACRRNSLRQTQFASGSSPKVLPWRPGCRANWRTIGTVLPRRRRACSSG
mmetsp:Transcript_6451/g.24091  ORF Transcript_6451/g.24091 Transcript_6451/m.24091 type:complete len:285 (+) Transcript_6451:451-1305(+)